MKRGTFIDWITASQLHPEGGLPILTGGCLVHYDSSGLPRFERNVSASVPGSYATAVRVGCDGFRVSISGNVGRFGRQDNVFNHGFTETIAAANRILVGLGLPALSSGGTLQSGEVRRGAVLSRLDITANFATGSESAARCVIRWLASRSIARAKRGYAGDESVWWSNTRHMLKAYVKHAEMVAHGAMPGEHMVTWLRERGVVRVEVELKKRLLSELKMNDLADVTDERIAEVFAEQTAIMRQVDRSEDADVIDAIPQRSRAYASAWLAGQDVRALCSRATLFRHARVLRDFGLDILEPRNVAAMPVRVRVVDLVQLEVPEWYQLHEAA